MRRGTSHGHKRNCPYCGGNHSAHECPMMMYPPAMPMPSMPMPPMDGMMPEMMEHMARIEAMLHEVHLCCMETNAMVKALLAQMAKG